MHTQTPLISLLLFLTPPTHANKPTISHLNLNPRAFGVPPVPRPAVPVTPKPVSIPKPIEPVTPSNPDPIPAPDPEPATPPNGNKPKEHKPDEPDSPDTPDHESDSPDSHKPDRDSGDVPDVDDGGDKPDDGRSSTTTRRVHSGSATITSSGSTSTSFSSSTSTGAPATTLTGAAAWRSFIDAGPSPTAESAPVSTPVTGGVGRVEGLGLGMAVSLVGVLILL